MVDENPTKRHQGPRKDLETGPETGLDTDLYADPAGAGARIAVALDSDGARGPTPRVIAKGRGALAEQILEIAFARGIKVRSDADLAEILGMVELDSEIPLEALAAVAEILSYIYRAQAQAPAPAGGAARS